jgi:hypothetical protein
MGMVPRILQKVFRPKRKFSTQSLKVLSVGRDREFEPVQLKGNLSPPVFLETDRSSH